MERDMYFLVCVCCFAFLSMNDRIGAVNVNVQIANSNETQFSE